jgi:hypothetical protein
MEQHEEKKEKKKKNFRLKIVMGMGVVPRVLIPEKIKFFAGCQYIQLDLF